MRKIKYNNIEYKIFINGNVKNGTVIVITVPQSIVLQDSLEEMLEDIGEYDFEYLREILNDNQSFTVA